MALPIAYRSPSRFRLRRKLRSKAAVPSGTIRQRSACGISSSWDWKFAFRTMITIGLWPELVEQKAKVVQVAPPGGKQSED
jgi:hypothetical protein